MTIEKMKSWITGIPAMFPTWAQMDEALIVLPSSAWFGDHIEVFHSQRWQDSPRLLVSWSPDRRIKLWCCPRSPVNGLSPRNSQIGHGLLREPSWGSPIWLVVWNILYFPIYWEETSQLTSIFQRGSNHQPAIFRQTHFASLLITGHACFSRQVRHADDW